jgi:hypothetical protein
MQIYKVIHVELKKPYKGRKHYYFGSKAAIYEHIPEKQIGIKLESLWNVDLTIKEYSNNYVIIRMGELDRKKTNRGGVKLTEDEIKRLDNE